MKDYEKCIEECDRAIKRSQEGFYDYVKLGKALARKANAKMAMKLYDEAIDLFKNSLLENSDSSVKDQLKKCERQKREEEEQKMLDPVKAEELRIAGNDFYAKGDYPSAVKTFTEGLRCDPNNKAIFSNRCAAYIKLLEFPTALKDAVKCLEIDPLFVKAHWRKGTIHHFMKEYHKALACFDQGLKIDP